MTAAAPYPGLRPFHPDEVDVFFGREEQIDQLLERLDRSRFLAVVGLSGSGKSSLVKAGLLPALETGLLASAGARWRVAQMRPGDQPLRRLAEALSSESALGPERGDDPASLGLLHATLRRGPLGLVEALADTPPPEGTRLLLVVDQFEEIFRYREFGDGDEAEAFVALLLAAAARPDVPLYVVLTMRSDFLGDCAVFEGLPEALNDCQFLTPRMRREQRRAAIVGPAGVFGAAIEPVLVNRLLNDMGDDPDQLPRMQHLLMRLWNRCERGEGAGSAERLITLADYEAVGGFEHALSRHADEAFEELDEEGRRIAERLFRALCERGDDQRDVRRPAQLGEVAAIAAVAPERVAEVVEVFRRPDRSFVTPPAGVPLAPETVLDVSHESLIRQWRRLRDWVEREALSASIYRRLAETARLWKAGEAGLWGPPDLEVALSWHQRQRPTAAWAARYGGGLPVAEEFLAASRDKRRRDEEAEHDAEVAAFEQRRVRQRNRLLTYGLVLGSALLVLSFVQWRRADEQRDRAERQTQLARAGELVAQAREAFQDRPQLGLLLAAEAMALERDAGIAGAGARHALQKGLSSSGGRGLAGHEGAITALAVSPDGNRLATAGLDGTVRLWDVAGDGSSPASRLLDGASAELAALAMGPRGSWLAAGALDGSVRLWDLTADDPAAAVRVLIDPGADSSAGAVAALAIDRAGRRLAAAGAGGLVGLWDLEALDGGAAPRRLEGHQGTVNAVALSADGRWLAAGGDDREVLVWDLAADAGAPPIPLRGHRGPVEVAAFTPDGRWLATAARDNTARLWRLADRGTAPIVLCGHSGSVVSLLVSYDGRWLVTGSSDASARIWRLPELLAGAAAAAGSPPRPVIAAAGGLAQCRHLLTDDAGSRPVPWDLRDLEPPITARLHGHFDSVTALALSPVPPGTELRFLATASLDHTIRLWSLTADDPDSTSVVLRGHDGAVQALAFHPAAPRLFSGGAGSTARIWDLSYDAETLFSVALGGPLDAVSEVALSADGLWLAGGSDDNDIHLWDIHYKQPPRLLRGHDSSISAIAMSPEDFRLASSSLDGTIRLWDLRDGAEPEAGGRVLASRVGTAAPLAYLPGGRLAGGAVDGGVRIWDVDAADPASAPAVLCGHTDAVVALAADAEGRRLASIGRGGTARLWDLEALVPPAHGGPAAPIVAAGLGEAACRGGGDTPTREQDVPAPTPAGGSVTAAVFVDAAGGGTRWLAVGDSTGSIALWDAAPGTAAGEPIRFRVRGGAVRRLAAGPGGRWLALAGDDAVAHLVDLAADPPGSRLLVLRDHRDAVLDLVFSPDGRWLATASGDSEARLWDLTAADPSRVPGVLYGHEGAVTSLVFAGDGSWLASGSRDHTVRAWWTYLWSLDSDTLVELACRVAGRDLTAEERAQHLHGRNGREVCSQVGAGDSAPANVR